MPRAVELVGITPSNDPQIGGIWVDAVLTEQHQLTNVVTSHPVEDGANIADHVRPEPDTVRMECLITNTPLRLPQSHAEGVSETTKDIETRGSPLFGTRLGPFGEVAVPGPNAKATVRTFEPAFDRVQDVWQELRRMRDIGELVTIRTTLHNYANMVLQEVSVPRTAPRNSMQFTVTAVQILTATSETALSQPDPAVQRAKPSASAGRQEVQALDDGGSESVAGRSAAAFLADWLGG